MRNKEIIPAVRAQLEQAQEKLHIAAKLLRSNGYEESADDIGRISKQCHIWTQPGGYLHYFEQSTGEQPASEDAA